MKTSSIINSFGRLRINAERGRSIKIFLLISFLFVLWQNVIFSAEITVLNIHSQPQAGDNWIVSFETIGSADLTITPDDKASIDDLDFISLKCGEEERTPQILKGDVIFYPDWFCNSEAKINHLVNITRAHILKFQFNDKIKYAYNSPDTTLYDFSSGVETDKWAFEKGGSQPTNPNDINLIPAQNPIDYDSISVDDDNRWQTSQALPNEWDSQVYTFFISESTPTITSLNLEWRGYGDTDSGFLTYFYIWNSNSSNWEQLDRQDFTSEIDITLTGNIISNISNYIDSVSKELTLMITTQKSLTASGEPCGGDGECASGFCRDGFCCNNDCSGDCEACNLSGTEGTCTVRSVNDNVEVTTTCYYCNGVSGISVAYSGDEGIGCSGSCTHCVSGSCSDWPDNEQHEGCTGFCMACQNGFCDFANNNTDPGGDCGYVGCYTGECNGSGVCETYSCPITCQKCSDTGPGCENATTKWGEGIYGCSAGAGDDPNRCYNGVCINCGGWGNAGYCWYEGVANQSCTEICSPASRGGVYVEAGPQGNCHWINDPVDCSTCLHYGHFTSCCVQDWNGPIYNVGGNCCFYHTHLDQGGDCDYKYSSYERICSCNK